MRQCRGCGLFFIPEKPDQDKCGRCKVRARVPFEPNPIDLHRQWS